MVFFYMVSSYLAKLNNDHNDLVWYKSYYFWTAFAFGALCPFWVIVSRISKNLLFDGMLYDNLMFLTYVFTMMALGCGAKFGVHQWIGVALVAFGSVLMRIG